MECGLNRPLTSLTRFRKTRTFHSDNEPGCWLQLLAVEMMRLKMLLVIQSSHEFLKCHQLQPDIQTSDINRAVYPGCSEPGGKDTDANSHYHQDLIISFNKYFSHYFDSLKMYINFKNMAVVCQTGLICGQFSSLSKEIYWKTGEFSINTISKRRP